MSLSQGEGQGIQIYVREAEQISKPIPFSKDPILAVAVIRGLRDDTHRHKVSFAIRGKKTSFAEAIDLIKAAYRSAGDSDPFKAREDRPHFNDTSPYYAMPPPAIPIAAASTITQQQTSTDGMRPR